MENSTSTSRAEVERLKELGREKRLEAAVQPASPPVAAAAAVKLLEHQGNATSSDETIEPWSPEGSRKKKELSDIYNLLKCSTQSHDYCANLVGSRIKVFWPLDQQFYEGTVQSYDSAKRKHKILYDDGDTEMLTLHKEIWRGTENDGPSKMARTLNSCRSKPMETSSWENEAKKHNRFSKKIVYVRRPSLSTAKTEALVPSDTIITKAAQGKRSTEVSTMDRINCANLSKDNAQAESGDEVNLDKENKEAIGSCDKRRAKLESREHTEATKEDHNGSGSKSIWEDSDDETLGSWLKRVVKRN